MSDMDGVNLAIARWLQPLADASAPCGPDLEYDNDFLALNQAAAGKPESQFGPAEPPDWRAAVGGAEALFERTRDLRVALVWLRGMLHTQGLVTLAPGLRLMGGLLREHGSHLHPLPDPDDGDPYARVNALTLLREPEGLIGDLRAVRIVADRAVGELSGRTLELALGHQSPMDGETDLGKAAVMQMLQAAASRDATLQPAAVAAAAEAQALASTLDEQLGSAAPDLKPLLALLRGLVSLLPPPEGAAADDGGVGGVGETAVAAGGTHTLAGAVNSREDAIRAIDMVCAYLERAEPTNPAPLFLRRARQLLNHNFLQLMKVLAPDALAEVAKVVGVDPDTIESPGSL